MAPNTSQPQGNSATYGSLSLPPSAEKKSSGWKLYVLAAAFGAIAVVALFMSFGQSAQQVASVQDDLSEDGYFSKQFSPNGHEGSRPSWYATQGGFNGGGSEQPSKWVDPDVFSSHDEFDTAQKFGGKWLIHTEEGHINKGSTLGAGGSNYNAGRHHTEPGTWRNGFKWASPQSAVSAEGWGPCYPACGYSVQFREVVCIRSDHTVVGDSFCLAKSSKPELARQCFNYSMCHPCWEVGQWGDCHKEVTESHKSRDVSCQMCETLAGGGAIETDPNMIPSPIFPIGFQSWKNSHMVNGGIMDGGFVVSLTRFKDLGLQNDDVCIYGGVGICDRTEYLSKMENDPASLTTESFFCGFDYDYNTDREGDITDREGIISAGCNRARSIERGYMCVAGTEGCDTGGDYGPDALKTLQARQKGYNCNVKPVDYTNLLPLSAWSHKEEHGMEFGDDECADLKDDGAGYVAKSAGGGDADNQENPCVGGGKRQDGSSDPSCGQADYNPLSRCHGSASGDVTPRHKMGADGGDYVGKYFWEMGPFESVPDPSNPAAFEDGKSPLPLSWGNPRDLKLFQKHQTTIAMYGHNYVPDRHASSHIQFMALKPKETDVCLNFCLAKYQWSIYSEAPRERPRQFSCMNGTWVNEEDGEVMQGCWLDEVGTDVFERAPMEIQEHNTHMYCGWGLDVTPYRCCRLVEYGTCADGQGGCYIDGAIDVDPRVDRGDHSSVHPHSYCGLKLLVEEESESKVMSRIEEMVSLPNVLRVACTNREWVYECQSKPNKNEDWPNEEPCVQPMAIINGSAVSQEYYPKGRCDLAKTEFGYHELWDESAHYSAGLPRRERYVKCTDANCAWGPEAKIEMDIEENGYPANGPTMDQSNDQGSQDKFHQVILVDWVDAYGTSCGDDFQDTAKNTNWQCVRDKTLDQTCEQIWCVENCTVTWVCNGWGTCHEKSMERITNRTQDGYCYARFYEFVPVDGDVIVSEATDGTQTVCHVAPLDTLETEREECQAGCDLISFQCRQCWCMQFLSQWDENRWTAAQEFAAIIDSTGFACYNGLTGKGSPIPEQLRSCRGKACPGIWTSDKCFSQVACTSNCHHLRQYRGVICANRYSHLREEEHLCVANPVGSDWELILSMASDTNDFDFGSPYWEDNVSIKDPSCADVHMDRKMHAYNSKKFDQIKMCFGYGFGLDNIGFESDASNLASMGSDLYRSLSPSEFRQRMEWDTDYALGAAQSGLIVYTSGAPVGDRYVAIYQTNIYQQIRGLQEGLKTTIRFMATSESDSDLGNVQVKMLGNDNTQITYVNVPAGEWTSYEVSFVPPQDGSGELRFTVSGGRVFLDGIVITSDGFEMVGYEAAGGNDRVLATFDQDGRNSNVYDNSGYRFPMSSMKFGPQWDEMMILSGGSKEDAIDISDRSKYEWYVFRPQDDPYLTSSGSLTVMTLRDLRTSDLSLETTIIDAGGAILCVAAENSADNAYWSINGVAERSNMVDKEDSKGCYRYDDDLIRPSGVYYGQNGFMGYVSDPQAFPMTGTGSTLRIFVRKANAHGSEDETQNNCVVYDFGEHLWQNATQLFSAGEILVGGEFVRFNEHAFERVYGTAPADNTCDENSGEGAKPKAGFNLNIDEWKCNSGERHQDTIDGIESFARWGYVTKQSDTCASAGDQKFDGAIGLGLFGHQHGVQGAVKASSGYTSDYSDGSNEWVRKETWVWVADSTQNPAIEGIHTFDIKDHNKPGYTVLDGASNKVHSVDMCKEKCKELDACLVGYWVKSGEDMGECWLASEYANSTEVADSAECDQAAGVHCETFEKRPILQHVDSNAYVYETHMVLPGYIDWRNNHKFATGTVFEIHDSSDKFSPVIFGPLTVREVISKQFSYGKQTYVYWQESDINFDTLRSKDVFVHTRSTDDLEMYGLPGKVVGCLYDGEEGKNYRHPRSGRTAEAMCNQLNKAKDACHGFSCWKNPNLVMNGGFEETDGEASNGVPGWEVMMRPEASGDPRFDVIDVMDGSYSNLNIRGPAPYVCESCVRFLHLLPQTMIKASVITVPNRDYILSFFYTGKICVGGSESCNSIKKANVIFQTQPQGDKTLELAVDVEGWGGAEDALEEQDEDTRAAARPFRWKHVLFEVTARYKVSSMVFEDKCRNDATSGVLIDEVVLQAAHPGDLGGNAWDNVNHEECATYCAQGVAKSECDFEVSTVDAETVEFHNSRVDKDWFAETICTGMNGERMDPVLCQKKSRNYPGVILSTDDAGGRQHYYRDEKSVKAVFGGMSAVLTDKGTGQTGYGPWRGLTTHFDNTEVTVFTYKIEFTTGITAILNIELTGQYFEGSIFKILSRAKTVLSLREVNLVVNTNEDSLESPVTYIQPGTDPIAQNFAGECANTQECKVVIPGSPVVEDTIFYFEEATGTTLDRIRSKICIRTPVCELLGEQKSVTHSHLGAHNELPAEAKNTCLDGLQNHLDCTDPDFFTNFESSKCTYVDAIDSDSRYGVPRAAADSAFKFSVKPETALNCVDSDPASCQYWFEFGLYEFEQQTRADRSGTPCAASGVESEPAYIIKVTRNLQGSASQTVQLLDNAGVELLSVTPTGTDNAITLEKEEAGQTLESYFWADMYQDKATGFWYVRFGVDKPSTAKTSPAIQDVTVGGDVVLQYQIPEGESALRISHAAVSASESTLFEVCSNAYRHGKMATDRSCFSLGRCDCEWHPEIQWEEILCDNNCGWGKKRRLVYCRMKGAGMDGATDHVLSSTNCQSTFGRDCIYEYPVENDHCKVQFFTASGNAAYDTKTLLPGAVDLQKPNLMVYKESIVFGSHVKQDDVPFATTSSRVSNMNWADLKAITVEGAGCEVLLYNCDSDWGSNLNAATADSRPIVARAEVPPGKEQIVWGEFSQVSDIPQQWTMKQAAHSCPDRHSNFKQSCACEAGCALLEIISDDDLGDYENDERAAFFHKPDLASLNLCGFNVAHYNPYACDPSDKPDTEIWCAEQKGCCVTCAYGDWGCGSTNCQMEDDEDNCEPPTKWNWANVGELRTNYDTWVGVGGCGSACDAVETRTLTCEYQDWLCAEWGADDGDRLKDYYLPKQLLLDYLDDGYTYQTKYEGPSYQVWYAGNSDGRNKPVCKRKQLVATASDDTYKRPLGASGDLPEELLQRRICGELMENTNGGKKYTSEFETCVARYTTPLNMYQYAEGCPETCRSGEWESIKTLTGNTNAAGQGSWTYYSSEVTQGQPFTNYLWRTKNLDQGVWASSLAKQCMPAVTIGSHDTNSIGVDCISPARVAKFNRIECSMDSISDDWVKGTDGLQNWQEECSTSSVEDTPGVLYTIQEHRCRNDKPYCACKWESMPWRACEGCGDILNYRKDGPATKDPDLDGVWCKKYGSGENGDTSFVVLYQECPLDALIEHGECCYKELGYRIGGCLKNARPNTAEHCIDFSQCTYEWHVRTNTAICDTFVSCVPWNAWKVDERAEGDEDAKREWCTWGPQRTTTNDDFVTYGLGACWAPDTQKRNPNFRTALQQTDDNGQQECDCYYGGSNFVGNGRIFNEGISTNANTKGYCNPVQVEGPATFSTMSIALGVTSASVTLKGAIYTDGGGGGWDRKPGNRVAITEEVTTTATAKQWVELAVVSKTGRGNGMSHGVHVVGGRYWLCIFAENDASFWRTKIEAQLDGTDAHGASLRNAVVDGYVINSQRFPPMTLETDDGPQGQISIYATYVGDSNAKTVYRQEIGVCNQAMECDKCNSMLSMGDSTRSTDTKPYRNEPCQWVHYSVENDDKEMETREKCVPRSEALSDKLSASNECQDNYAMNFYLGLEGWSCAYDSSTAGGESKTITYKQLLATAEGRASGDVPSANLEECAESCYYANMHWIGWTGSYRSGLNPHQYTQDNSISSGRIDYFPSAGKPGHVDPFYCQGFNYAEDECVLIKPSGWNGIDTTNGVGGKCFVNKDSANPCGFGANYNWVIDSQNKFYYVAQEDGFLEKITVGVNGPAKCGSSNNVFSNPGYPGFVTPGNWEPQPSLTCSTDACKACVEHSLTRGMLAGVLAEDAEDSSDCKLLTTSKKITACDAEPLTLKCPTGEAIVIGEAKYGRIPGASICSSLPEGALDENPQLFVPEYDDFAEGTIDSDYNVGGAKKAYENCWADQTTNVGGSCGGQSECVLQVSDIYAEDPVCKNVFSYLSVEYHCSSPSALNA